MDLAVVCEGLSKRYLLGEEHSPVTSMVELAQARLRGAGRRRTPREEIWALRDFDLEVQEGEVLGLIGRNGAGKSTLLKILSRITEPTSGRARIRGRVGALLEVGTAFDPELTGRENVFINGALLGMTRRDVERRFDDIVEFAGVERFIDTPVKRFSSGMFLRLGFAVAAHMEPEIMVVDEVLAVGDAEFQRRCLSRMSALGQEGRTVLYVSHDLASLAQLCSRCVWIDAGSARADGPPAAIIARYLEEGVPDAARLTVEQRGPIRLEHIELRDDEGRPTESVERGTPLRVALRIALRERRLRADAAVWILDERGRRIFDEALLDDLSRAGILDEPGVHELVLEVPPLLPPGRYVIGVWLGDEEDGTVLDTEVLRFDVPPGSTDRADAAKRVRAVSPVVRWAHDRL